MDAGTEREEGREEGRTEFAAILASSALCSTCFVLLLPTSGLPGLGGRCVVGGGGRSVWRLVALRWLGGGWPVGGW